MHKLYEEWIDPAKALRAHHEKPKTDQCHQYATEIYGIAKYLRRTGRDLQLLDFSMGWGLWCRIAQDYGCDVHGTEYSRSRSDYARGMGVEVIAYEEIGDHRYDFINTEQVFEHIPRPHETFSYLKGSLKPNGILKVAVPDGHGIKGRLARWRWTAPKGDADSLNAVAPLEHINCFGRHSLCRMAEDAGLAPVDLPGVSSPPTRSLERRLGRAGALIHALYWRLRSSRPFRSGGRLCMAFRARG